jgi:hypothetical protein
MMVLGIPEAVRRVIAASGDLEEIGEVITDDEPFDVDDEIIRACGRTHLAEQVEAIGEDGAQVSDDLADEKAFGTGTVCREVTEVGPLGGMLARRRVAEPGPRTRAAETQTPSSPCRKS